jgi:hypothetical protein
MMSQTKFDELKETLRELIQQDLDEASVTGAIDGGEGPPKTPFAFRGKRKKDKKKKEKIANQSGYNIAEAKFAVKFQLGKSTGETATIIVDVGSKGAAEQIVAKNLKQGRKGIVSVKRVEAGKAKQIDKKLENVNEGRYHDYRNDESLTPKQKIGRSMMEVRDTLKTLESIVGMNIRLKNEIGVDSTSYWKRTHGAMKKISERLVKLANKVGQLH